MERSVWTYVGGDVIRRDTLWIDVLCPSLRIQTTMDAAILFSLRAYMVSATTRQP